MIAESARIIVRPFTTEDTDDIFEFIGAKYAADEGIKPVSSIAEAGSSVKHMTEKNGFFGVELKSAGKIIGLAALTEDRKRSYDKVRALSFILNRDYSTKGYMTEAASLILRYGFINLGLELISSYCYPYNLSSALVLKRLRFNYEGRLMQCEKRFDGLTMDHDCYSLKADQFKNYLLCSEAGWLALHCD